MADYTWTNSGGGDWSDAANWFPALGAPPGDGDGGAFNDLADSYTVTVKAGTTVGSSKDGVYITIDATSPIKDVAFSISGSLVADISYFTDSGGPATTFTIEDGGSFFAPTLIAAFDVAETITISGTGTGGRLELGDLTVGVLSGTVPITFDFDNTNPTGPNGGVIQFDKAFIIGSVAEQKITDVAWGNEFVVKGADFTGNTVTFDELNNDLIVKDVGGATVFTMNNVFLQDTATTFVIAGPDTIEAICYARGTMIRTPDGERSVETLCSGKRVITLVDGEAVTRPVRWVGHRRIDLTRHPRPESVAPVRIERDAFADNVPHRDLLVSPDHAVFVDGMLICARQLVNGTTIRREKGWSSVDYYHVQLNEHAILLAEGLPAESYLDTGNRGFFANAGTPLVLHPDLADETDHPTREAGSCAPFVWGEASVRPVWQRLVERADAIGRVVSRHATTTEAGLHLACPGWQRTIEPIHHDDTRVVFVLPGVASEVRLMSRAQAPTEARPWLDDQRRLGVRVNRIVLRGAGETRVIPMDHPELTHGWWAIEHDVLIMSRWTDGDAVLPLPSMRGPVLLEIHLSGAMTYAEGAVPVRGAAQIYRPRVSQSCLAAR